MVKLYLPVLAALLAFLGATVHPIWFWPAAVCLATWVVYLASVPAAFGKRLDGTMSPLAYIVWAPLYAYQWMILILGRRFVDEPIATEVSPGIWVGRRPNASDLPPDIAIVVDLCAEFPAAAGVRAGRRYLAIPTLDTRAPTPAQITAAVDAVEAASGPAFIHCAHGHGRSATVAAAVLVRRKLATLDDVEAKLKSKRPRIGLNANQRAALAAAC